MRSSRESTRRHVLALALLAGLVLAAYANSFQTGFAFDNRALILQDQRVQAANARNLGLIFHQNYWGDFTDSGLYRPVITLSYLFNYAILRNADHPFGYHLINYLLHGINAYLVYLLALVVLDSFWQAFFTGALWALHPVLTESVTNIVGRADELAAVAVLGGLLLYIRVGKVQGWQRRLPYLLGIAAITTVGVFSKESAVVVLGLAVLYDATYGIRPRIESYAALALPILAMWYVRWAVFAKTNAAVFPFLENPLVEADIATAWMTAVKVLGKYLWLLVWPQKLSCDYSYNQIPLVDSHLAHWEDWKALIALAAVVGILFVAGSCYRRHKAVFFFIGVATLTILPTANFFVRIGTIMAERFLYLPAVGFAGCLVLMVNAVCGRFGWRAWAAPVALSAVGAALAMRTFLRNPDWTNNETLWTRAVEVCPASYKAHFNLSHVWFEKDQSRVERSISQAEQALAIIEPLPDSLSSTTVFEGLAAYYGAKGDMLANTAPMESHQWYQKALQTLLRGVAVDHEFNATCRRRELARGRPPGEIGIFGTPALYWNLSQVYLRLGDRPQAEQALIYQHRLVSYKGK